MLEDNMGSGSEYELPNRAQVVMTMLLMHKEKIETQYTIGGRVCFIKASYVNGNVQGSVSPDFSSKKFEFEFTPLKSLQKKQLIIAEMNRLYWEYFPPNGVS